MLCSFAIPKRLQFSQSYFPGIRNCQSYLFIHFDVCENGMYPPGFAEHGAKSQGESDGQDPSPCLENKIRHEKERGKTKRKEENKEREGKQGESTDAKEIEIQRKRASEREREEKRKES